FNTGSKRPASTYFCNHCKIPGHSIDKCFKLHGYPPNFKGFKEKRANAAIGDNDLVQPIFNSQCEEGSSSASQAITQAQYQHFLSLIEKLQSANSKEDTTVPESSTGQALLAGKFCFLSTLNDRWFIDSGATDHMCCDLNMLNDHQILTGDKNYKRVPDGRKVPVTHIGKVQLNSYVVLENVLYVPDFHYNLISVNKLCKDMGCQLIFTHDTCLIQVPSLKERKLVLGKLQGGLYNFGTDKDSDGSRVDSASLQCNSAVNSTLNNAKLWHLRMGHVPFSQLQLVVPDVILVVPW
ncbi:Retrovirus-related Pol polyprotein from transposon RE1, partial [Bienertia sinuspersici]